MRHLLLKSLWLVIGSSMGLAILFTAISYFEPDFSSGFLLGREGYFYGLYQGMLVFHGVSASLAILIAGFLIWLKKGTALHRFFGKWYGALVLFLAAPTGFYLSFYALGNWTSTLAFLLLSLLWWLSTWLAISGKDHAYWIRMSYLLACSAYLLRVLILVGIAFDLERIHFYQWAAWLCWLPGLVIYLIFNLFPDRPDHQHQTYGRE